jgi:hypothetical protein
MTAAQIRMVGEYQKKVNKAKRRLVRFMNYVIEDSGLPAVVGGYSIDQTGTAIVSNDPAATGGENGTN